MFKLQQGSHARSQSLLLTTLQALHDITIYCTPNRVILEVLAKMWLVSKIQKCINILKTHLICNVFHSKQPVYKCEMLLSTKK
jgi:hypothetical protein